jgi:hypothetical protein
MLELLSARIRRDTAGCKYLPHPNLGNSSYVSYAFTYSVRKRVPSLQEYTDNIYCPSSEWHQQSPSAGDLYQLLQQLNATTGLTNCYRSSSSKLKLKIKLKFEFKLKPPMVTTTPRLVTP